MKKCTLANNRIFVVCAGLAKIEQQYENISYFCNAETLIKRAAAGLVQRAVCQNGGLVSSKILFNFSALALVRVTVETPSASCRSVGSNARTVQWDTEVEN